MANFVLTSDFTAWALENYDIDNFINGRNKCLEKLNFYQSEYNSGRTAPSIVEQIEYWQIESEKWVPIIEKAEERDRIKKDKWDSYFTK